MISTRPSFRFDANVAESSQNKGIYNIHMIRYTSLNIIKPRKDVLNKRNCARVISYESRTRLFG